jgi:5-hydroxyisourate hydrolase-like protein (transthyretin family)
MRTSGFRCWLVLACVVCCSRGLVAQDLKVLVLDALDGKPQAGVEVQFFCIGLPPTSPSNRFITNNEGFVKISNPCNDQQKIEISVFSPNKKEQCGDDFAMTFDDVVATGFISKPDSAGGIWCPTKVSRRLKAVPGQVILFVKKPTWYQSHIAG